MNQGYIQRSVTTPLRWLVAGSLIIVAGFVIALIFSPPGQRLLANPTGAPAQVGVTQIVVRGDAAQNHVYDPPVVRVPVGTTITWTFDDRGRNGDSALVPHDIVFEGFRSDILSNGTFSHTFDQPGTYRYYCSLHRFMEGQIEVVAQ